ncbi:MAG: ExeM/NucH family extracellular endonuclease [Trueperaceae bacterium]
MQIVSVIFVLSLVWSVRGQPTETTASTPIFAIQGDGETSPYVGQLVTVRGVVVGDFQGGNELRGFFLQDIVGDGLPETSDGIFVFHGSTAVEVGEVVEVTGEVDEYHGLTELTNVESVTSIGRAVSPRPTKVYLPLPHDSSWERYEGMLITVAGDGAPLAVAEVYHLGRGGLVMLADRQPVQFTQENEPDSAEYARHVATLGRRTILLDDGSLEQNPDPIRYSASGSELTAHRTLRVGDTTSAVTGILSYSYNGWRGTDAYRIHATRQVEFAADNARPPLPPEVGGTIQVASFNVLNLFNGDGRGAGFPTSRGAESAQELERQLEKLVSAIVPMDAEVLGIIEIENDEGPDSALADLVAGLNSAAGEGTYAYVDTGIIGPDEIKVALAYQPNEVRPVGRYRVLNSSIADRWRTLDPRFNDTRNRPALAQTFEELSSGERFTVIVNHLKSKGSACPGEAGRPVDGQGNCSDVRVEAAKALLDWARELARESGDPDVLIAGDLNAYAMEDPVRVLLSGGYENLLGAKAITYLFAGESGTLDYALASSSLAQQVTAAAVWHINAQEPSVLDYNTNFKSDRQVGLLYSSSPFRSSDHDPILVGLKLEM